MSPPRRKQRRSRGVSSSALRARQVVPGLLIGRLLRWAAADARLVAATPHAILSDGEPESEESARADVEHALGVWASLGFSRYPHDIWIMDPALATHGDAIRALEQKLGIATQAG